MKVFMKRYPNFYVHKFFKENRCEIIYFATGFKNNSKNHESNRKIETKKRSCSERKNFSKKLEGTTKFQTKKQI